MKKKRILSLLLAAALFCALLPQIVLPASSEMISGDCGPNTKWKLNTITGELRISGHGGLGPEYDYTLWRSNNSNEDYRNVIRSLVVEDGVTEIWGLDRCANLQSVELPNSLIEIGFSAFEDCKSLTRVDVPRSVCTIRSCAFNNCVSLTEVNIPDGVEIIGSNAFSRCQNLVEISIPDSVTKLGGAFFGCSLLSSVRLPKNIKEIDQKTFCHCTSLTSLTLPEGITRIGSYAFGNCAIRQLEIPESVSVIDDRAFWKCDLLKDVTIPAGVTELGEALFEECYNLKSVSILNPICYIDPNAFVGKEYELTIYGYSGSTAEEYANRNGFRFVSEGAAPPPPTVQSGSFGEAGLTWKMDSGKGLLQIRGKGVMDNCQHFENYPWAAYQNDINRVEIGYGVESIGTNAFSGCRQLETVSIADSVAKIGDFAFQDCVLLADVELPEAVSGISVNAFAGCDHIQTFTVQNPFCEIEDHTLTLGVSGVTNIYGYNRSTAEQYAEKWGFSFVSLGEASLPEHKGSCGEAVEYKFFPDTGLLQIYGSGAMQDYEAHQDQPWFSYETDILRVEIGLGVTTVGKNAFDCCSSLTEVELPETLAAIGADAFEGKMSEIVLPSSLRVIGKGAFNGCNELSGIAIPNGVTEIGEAAFWFCPLTSVTIPASVRKVGENAFHGCKWLEEVFVLNPDCEIFDDSDTLGLGSNGTVIVGFADSTAEAFAKKYGYTFSRLASFSELLDPDYTGEIGPNLSWELFPESGVLQICGTGPMYTSFNEEGYPWKRFIDDIKKVVLDYGITSVSSGAFSGCEQISSVRLPESLVTVGSSAFEGCKKLMSVTVPESVLEIGERAFCKCSKLVGITVKNPYCRILNESAIGYAGKTLGVPGRTTVKGCPGSTAQEYAEKWGYAFKELEKETPVVTFTDVAPTAFYAEAVSWAVNHNPPVTNGISDTEFGPKQDCTRGQVVTFLWRAAGEPNPTVPGNPFVDVKEKDFYYKAVLWAVGKNVTKGLDETHFGPKQTCTRGQVVTFLWRAVGEPKPTASQNPFVDVMEKDFYYKAVLWAVDEGITKGVDDTNFAPKQTCTRGHVVTFLYRAGE